MGLLLNDGDLSLVRGQLHFAARALEQSFHPDTDLIASLRRTAEELHSEESRAIRDEMRARLAAKQAERERHDLAVRDRAAVLTDDDIAALNAIEPFPIAPVEGAKS